MSGDWKELEDVGMSCGDDNGYCGWCGNCREHSEWLHKQEDWGDEE